MNFPFSLWTWMSDPDEFSSWFTSDKLNELEWWQNSLYFKWSYPWHIRTVLWRGKLRSWKWNFYINLICNHIPSVAIAWQDMKWHLLALWTAIKHCLSFISWSGLSCGVCHALMAAVGTFSVNLQSQKQMQKEGEKSY